ncbi:MAG TPA: excisionase family DNA-binding protein [Gammaproteobacteria bacterium]|jgi:excisionase family DNA binding protein|nr:excisionase family DNA-binding protein [Gammaproteobacteria bacterium]
MSIATEPFAPTEKDVKLAEESERALASYLKTTNDPVFTLKRKGGSVQQIHIPVAAISLLVKILREMANGSIVTLIPVHAELTTQQAADILNVSRPYLVDLLEKRKIPFHTVGSRRRVFANDLLRYKKKIDDARLKTLEELSKQAQDLDMGY